MPDDLSGFSMLELFRLEAESQTEILSQGILSIEKQQPTAETIESLMRAAHSLKGAARIVGLDGAVKVAHALEDLFIAAGEGSLKMESTDADLLLAGVDFLSAIAVADDHEGSDWAERASKLVGDLNRALSSELPPAENPAQATPLPPEASLPPPEATPHQPQSQPGQPQPLRTDQPPSVPPSASEEAPASVPPTVGPPPQPGNQAASTPAAPVTPPAPASAPPPASVTPVTPAARAERSSAVDGDDEERVVRVSAGSLSRLVGLAGESLVEARQLRPFVDSLQAIRTLQTSLCDAVATVEDGLRSHAASLPASQLTAVESLRQRAGSGLDRLTQLIEAFEGFARRNEDLSERLHREVIFSRMRPLADGIQGFPRLVRDLSRQLGKQVQLEVIGDQTGVDRDILDKLEAPLSHLIRNALDHGMELPAERRQAGKPETGTITLEAGHRAGSLTIVISDDGKGINTEALRERICERNLVTPAVANRLSEAELLEFLFLPGFSTRNAVTEISGRGVGLDVVQTMVKAVGGSVRVSTQLGRQTRFTLQLPITMSVIRALLVDIGGDPYAFPLPRIDHILTCQRDHLASVEGYKYVDHDGTAIGLVNAGDVLDVPQTAAEVDPLSIVVISDRGQRFGMVVDGFLGERDLEVRPLDPRLGKVPDINSASLLENGDPVLIVDVEDIVRSIDSLLTGRGLSPIDTAREELASTQVKRILVVDDSITVRELERQLLQARGFQVDVAVDGMDGWNAFRNTPYDLVVSDVDMPRMDGIGLVTLIKTDAQRSDVPVVIVSYKDREEDRLRGLEAGANRYLTKSSFHDETFIDTIVELIGEPTD